MPSYLDILANTPVPQEDIDYFSALRCTDPYLSEASAYLPVPFITRLKYHKNDTSDTFFSATINTNDTIPRLLAFIRKDGLRLCEQEAFLEQNANKPFFVVFVQLQSGVNGFRDVLHGGVLASLFDEVIGLCGEGYRASISPGQEDMYTATLEIIYRSTISTPSVGCIRSWVEKREGRKWFLRAQFLDTDGVVKAEAKSLYITSKISSWL